MIFWVASIVYLLRLTWSSNVARFRIFGGLIDVVYSHSKRK
jgi:hypothetical protein